MCPGQGAGGEKGKVGKNPLDLLKEALHIVIEAVGVVGEDPPPASSRPEFPGPPRVFMAGTMMSDPDWLSSTPEEDRVLGAVSSEDFRTSEEIALRARFIRKEGEKPPADFYFTLRALTRKRVLDVQSVPQSNQKAYRLHLSARQPPEAGEVR